MKVPVRNGGEPGRLDPGMDRYAAAVDLFANAIACMHDLRREWRTNPDDETLHDLRVGIRRVRVLLRIFEKDASFPEAVRLRERTGRIADALGAVRDIDVMLELLTEVPAAIADTAPACAVLHGKRTALGRKAATAAGDTAWKREEALTRRFLSVLASAGPVGRPETIGVFFDRSCRKLHRKINRSGILARSSDAEELHAFRKLLRRLRYLGDVLAPIATPRQARLFKKLHKAEQCLGRLHDADVLLAFLASGEVPPAPRVNRRVAILREDERKEFRKRWKTCRQTLSVE